MNRTFAKRGFQAMLSMVFVLGALLLSNSAFAQSSNNLTGATPQQWLTEAEALNVLYSEMGALRVDLQSFTPGSPAYINAELHLNYYKDIYQNIKGGTTVPMAVAASIAPDDAVTNQLPKPVLLAMYNEVVDLLTN